MKVVLGVFQDLNDEHHHMNGRPCVTISMLNGQIFYWTQNPDYPDSWDGFTGGAHTYPKLRDGWKVLNDPNAETKEPEIVHASPLSGLQAYFGQEIKHLTVDFK